MIYNLSAEDRKIIDTALTVLAQQFDLHNFKGPDQIFGIRNKIKTSSTVQLITDTKKRTFSDEG